MSNLNKSNDTNICGLYNLGNTCYMNSILQILFHTYELQDVLSKPAIDKLEDTDHNKLLKELSYLLEETQKSNESISPQAFLQEFQAYAVKHKLDNFVGFDQNDASEFLIILMDYLYECLGRPVNMNVRGSVVNKKDALAKICYEKMKEMYTNKYSEILKIFYGFSITEIHTIRLKKCIVQTPQPFFMLNLPIPNNKKEVTIMDCLNEYLENELIDYTYNGANEECSKTTKFYNFPEILIISFNRFNHLNRKNHKIIYFPFENLDLNPFVSGYNTNNEFTYNLYGICNHSGSSLGGHYTSMAKTANDKWYNFNDRLVSPIQTNVHNLYEKAYVLFYRKKKQ